MRIDYRNTFPAGVRAMAELERSVRSAARARGEHQTRLDTVAAWREAPYYTARERAALAWCETLTELPRTGAPDELYALVGAEFSDEEVAALTFAIVAINGWNRLAVGLRSDVLTLDGLDLPAEAAASAGQ